MYQTTTHNSVYYEYESNEINSGALSGHLGITPATSSSSVHNTNRWATEVDKCLFRRDIKALLNTENMSCTGT